MVKDEYSTSDGDTDLSSSDLNCSGKRIFEPGVLQKEWEAVECNLYHEDDDAPTTLKPNLLHECRIWKETFPYLRVKGKRIENPLLQRRQSLKQQIISSIVDQIILKLNDGVLTVENENIQSQDIEQSYFERGKTEAKVIVKSLPTKDKIGDTVQSVVSKNSHVVPPILLGATAREGPWPALSHRASLRGPAMVDIKSMQPRGILKNSPHRRKVTKLTHERKSYKESTSQAFRSSSLPRISSTNNNWLCRSEKQNPMVTRQSCRRMPPNLTSARNTCTCRSQTSEFILPPIQTPADVKRI